MAALSMTAYAAALKEMYPTNRIESLTFKKNVTYAMLPKDANVGGESWRIPVEYEDIAGSSATFSVAQANKAGSLKVAFSLTAADDYSVASIKGKTWRASQGNTKAFLAANKSELDSAFNAQRRRLGISLFRDGSGAIARIAASGGISSSTITLSNKAEINNIGKGMKLVLASSTTGAVRSGTLTVSTVNRSTTTGTFTTTVAVTTAVTGASNSDYIFVEGDAHNAVDYKKMRGFSAWLPTTAPTSGDSFFGVDRSADAVRLAGSIISGSGLTVEEALIEAQTEVSTQGGLLDMFVMPNLIYKQLSLELGAKKQYVDAKVGNIGFRGIVLEGDEGPIECFADRNCEAGLAYGLQKSTWKVYSIGPMPGILDLDNVGSFLRESTDDAYELRVGGYPQLGCSAPGWNCVVNNLPTS